MLSGVIVAPADAESDIIAAGFKILNIREGGEQDNLVPCMNDFMVEGPDSALEVIDDDGRWGEWIWSLEDDVEDQQKCKKCGGAGWVWGRELDDPSEDTYQDDMTKYSCDWCNRDDDEDQQLFSLEGCVEHKSGGDVIVGKDQIRCETCYHWDERESICGGAGTCDKHDLWAPKQEPTKTMTVDEVAKIVEKLMMEKPWNSVDFVAKERSQAIAEALRGVTVKQ